MFGVPCFGPSSDFFHGRWGIVLWNQLEYTDRKSAPWFIIDVDNKKRARLNCIAHLLTQVPYKDLHPIELELPPRQEDTGYKRPKKSSQRWITRIY